MSINKSLFSSEKQDWNTPIDLFDKLNEEFNFDLDAAASSENALCERYYTIEDDALTKNWDGTVFCNPPYGRNINKFVEKAYLESKNGSTVVMLIPARTDTKYWHDYIFPHAQIRFLKGRLHFSGSKNSAPFPSAIVIFKKETK